jgi:hypothetical protein
VERRAHVGGIVVARRGPRTRPMRALQQANVAMWTICALFPNCSSIALLASAAPALVHRSA